MQFKRKFFNPRPDPEPSEKDGTRVLSGDRRDTPIYDYGEDDDGHIILAVNAALAAGRPLLIEGPPGSGKSSLAPHIAQTQGWSYYARVVTSRTTAQDLLWDFDALR